MAVALVVFNGSRYDELQTNTNTGHWVGSGGAPTAELQNAYQAALCVNKKTTSTTLTGIDCSGAGSINMTSTANKLWFVKVYVTDAFSLSTTYGVAAGVGSTVANYYKYVLSGTNANLTYYDKYPSQGGYILTAIDPNITAWRESTTGSPNLAAVDWYGVQCAFAITGSAKSENLAFDSIDIGTGLTITAGDGVSTEGNFPNFVTFDQDTLANRYGCVSGSGKSVNAWCMLNVGTTAVTEFKDVDSIVTFKDGYHSAGLVGVTVDMKHASTIVQIDCTIIGEGTRNGVAANDTRPDFIVLSSLGTFSSAANLRNHRNITYISLCDVDGADIECELLTQASANISNTIIRTNSLTSVACLQDPIFGTSTDLHDCEFIQSGVGHAIELSTIGGTYSFTNLTFTGYGADTTDDAALDITAASGTTTINVSGGTATPTYKTAGATVTIVSTVNVTLTGLQDTTEVRVMQAGSNTVELDGTNDATDGTAGDRSFTFGLSAGTSVDIYIVSVLYENIEVYAYTIPSTATSLPQQQRFDRSYLNN